MPISEASLFPHLGAFESTRLVGSGTDILGTTRHSERWESDLDLLRSAGIVELRYPVPWHQIERVSGEFDFSWMDGPMRYMQAHGMRPILDPLHHVSFPEWLEQGFNNPAFPDRYERFIVEVARRYPWADRFTVFNEPLPTTLLCSLIGVWYPYQMSEACFVKMAINVGRAICQASAALRRINPDIQLVHVETAESHFALDKRSEHWVRFANGRRFLMHDLVLGSIDRSHELFEYMESAGDLQWFGDNPVRFDVLGLDYYAHSEIDWYWDKGLKRANIGPPVQLPYGFARLGKLYADRFKVPILLSETNLRGTFSDRLTWLKFMEEQCESLALETDFRGFCWFPTIDSTDWCNLCTRASCEVDPQGIWGLSEDRWKRHSSELSRYYEALARGSARAADLPAYKFSRGAAKILKGYQRLMTNRLQSTP